MKTQPVTKDENSVAGIIGALRAQEEREIRAVQTETRVGFNPRHEVSEDARYIVKRIVGTLWTICVFVPVVLGVIYELAKK